MFLQFFFLDDVNNSICYNTLICLLYTVEELDAAYKLTCKEDTVEVFNACINLVGHHKAGMTSLAIRLMGKDFREDVHSTDGPFCHTSSSIHI